MNFKKDYINYVLFTVISGSDDFCYNKKIKQLVEKIIASEDIVKITYLVGKTAGLDFLFKYLLYISDKIDRSQITIMNLRDNFDYDVKNLVKVFYKINDYEVESTAKKLEAIDVPEEKPAEPIEESAKEEERVERDSIKIEVTDEESTTASEEIPEIEEEQVETETEGLTLIENSGDGRTTAEVFELSEISDDIEQTSSEKIKEPSSEEIVDPEEEAEDTDSEEETITEETSDEKSDEEVFDLEGLEEDMSKVEEEAPAEEKLEEVKEEESEEAKEEVVSEKEKEIPVEVMETEVLKVPDQPKKEITDIPIEIKKPVREYAEITGAVKEESVTNEAYYKFENKFFEEVKILEKLFYTVEKDCKGDAERKLGERCLQSLTEIIEITSGLSDLSRQLSFDLIADIFMTMNIYFTKAINSPAIISSERINLLRNSLGLVNSLIKGKDYLDYDVIVDKIEALREDMERTAEVRQQARVVQSEKIEDEVEEQEPAAMIKQIEPPARKEPVEKEQATKIAAAAEPEPQPQRQQVRTDIESVNFKMRYLVKEFEKTFISIGEFKGEYSRFEALDRIDELNNSLRLIARISSTVRMQDVLKLSEVSYVFLKYLKDYRMNLLEPEIQQILKYVIFTFKMLLTNRKPEDFNVLVQYLNNPVKIFTDTES